MQLPKLKSDLDSWCDRVNSSMKKLAENFSIATALKAEFLSSKLPESASINNVNQVVDCEMEVNIVGGCLPALVLLLNYC